MAAREGRVISRLCVTFLLMGATPLLLGGRGERFSQEEKSKDIIVVLDWSLNTFHTGLYVAKKKGYFKEEGVAVTIEIPPETGGESLLLARVATFAVSYQESVTFARAKGHPLVAIAAIMQHNTSGFAARQGRGIVTIGDFEGKMYGGWGSPSEEATLRAIMRSVGGDLEKISIVPIGTMDFFTATQSGIDFTWIFEGWDGVAAGLKGVDIVYFPVAEVDTALDYYTPLLVAREDFLSTQPEIVRRFMKAVSRGYAFCRAYPQRAAEILLEEAPDLDRDLVVASQIFLAQRFQEDAPRWGEMKRSVWERYATWLKRHHLLEGVFEADSAFTNAFLPE